MKNLILLSLLFFGCGPERQIINVDAGNDDSENSINQGGATSEGGTGMGNGSSTSGGNTSSGGSSTNPWEESIPDDYEPQPLPDPLPEPMPDPSTDRDGIVTWICKFLPKNPICEFGSDLGDDAINGIICSIMPNLDMCDGESQDPKPQPSNPIKTCEDKIIFEAESFTSQSGYSVIDKEGASGKVIQVGDSGVVNYKINFPSSGRWFIQIRTMAEGHTDNGLYFNIDGERIKAPSDHPLAGVSQIWLMKGSVWSWKPKFQGGHSQAEGPVVFDLSRSGEHTFSIEKKLVERPFIDKIILSKQDLNSSDLDSINCEPVNQEPDEPNEDNGNLFFNIIIEQTEQPCASCGIIFDWQGDENRKPLLIINHGDGSGKELRFRDEISSISVGSNRFNNKPNVMLLKKQFDSRGYLIGDMSKLPKGSPINKADLCLNLHNKEGLANSDRSSILSIFNNLEIWRYNSGVREEKGDLIREIKAERDFWGQGISKANPWGCYDFTDHVNKLQNERG